MTARSAWAKASPAAAAAGDAAKASRSASRRWRVARRATRERGFGPVYEQPSGRRRIVAALLASLCLFTASAIASPRIDAAQSSAGTLLDARDALRKKDRDRLAGLRTQASAEANALAMWVDYWELTNRIGEAQQ